MIQDVDNICADIHNMNYVSDINNFRDTISAMNNIKHCDDNIGDINDLNDNVCDMNNINHIHTNINDVENVKDIDDIIAMILLMLIRFMM